MKIKEINRFSVRVFDTVLKLLPQLDPESELPTREHFKAVLKSKDIHFFIAETESKDIAGILTVVRYIVPTGTKVWIEDVVVNEQYRGRGLGCRLIQYAIDFARSTGAKSVDLTSKPSRIAANYLYKKCGFVLRETNVYRYLL